MRAPHRQHLHRASGAGVGGRDLRRRSSFVVARSSARRAAAPAARGRRPARAAAISCAMRPLTITPMRSATSIATPRFCSISSTAISPPLPSCAQRLHHLLDDHRRQAFGRLVHHQQARLEQQRAADRQHLLLAARQLRAAVALALGQAREHRVDALDVALARRATRRSVSSTRQRRPHAPALRHVGDAAPRDLVAAPGRGSPRRPAARCRWRAPAR